MTRHRHESSGAAIQRRIASVPNVETMKQRSVVGPKHSNTDRTAWACNFEGLLQSTTHLRRADHVTPELQHVEQQRIDATTVDVSGERASH